MRRKAEDRLRYFPDIPTTKCPGEDYFWDGDYQKWVYIEDDADMSWIMDSLEGKDVDPDKKVRNIDDGNSGKKWKETMCLGIGGDTWEKQKAFLEQKGLRNSTKEGGK